MNIYIIGLPGSGKKTIANALANKINFKYLELDGIIAKSALMFTDHLIHKYGFNKYYELETEALIKVKDLNEVVVACGQGIVENIKNKALMDGIVIYLDVELNKITERLSKEPQKEILKENTLEDLNTKRFLKYRNFANIIISNNDGIEDTISNILKHINIKTIN